MPRPADVEAREILTSRLCFSVHGLLPVQAPVLNLQAWLHCDPHDAGEVATPANSKTPKNECIYR